jgi:flagellar biosynthesis protein FlhF
MRLKTFAAATLTDAMADVRREMGPDAVIIGAYDGDDGGVEVRAAIEALSEIEPAEPARERVERMDLSARVESGADDEELADRLIKALGFHRAPGFATQSLLRSAIDLGDGRAVSRLAHAMETRYTFLPLPPVPEKPVLFAGAPGSGKTSALAKTAARIVAAGAKPFLISCDGERAGADARLAALAEKMGANFKTADDPRELADLMRAADGPTLIDSPAVNPFELDDLDMTLAFADSGDAEILFVSDAGQTPEDAEDSASLFASIGASRCIPMKLDCARRMGSLIAVGETGLAYAQFSASPFIGAGLAPATPLRLARALLDERDLPDEEDFSE